MEAWVVTLSPNLHPPPSLLTFVTAHLIDLESLTLVIILI